MSRTILILLRSYRKLVSPLLGMRCRFYPSCSCFMTEAVEKMGWRGCLVGVRRLLRCHPWNPGGYDPLENWMEKR